MTAMRKLIRRCLAAERGIFALELAFVAPVLTGLILGGVEVTRYVLLNQKVERTSVTMGDLVSQAEILTEANISSLFDASTGVMAPFSFENGGQVIVSSISVTGGNPAVINWQRAYGTQGSTSALGAE